MTDPVIGSRPAGVLKVLGDSKQALRPGTYRLSETWANEQGAGQRELHLKLTVKKNGAPILEFKETREQERKGPVARDGFGRAPTTQEEIGHGSIKLVRRGEWLEGSLGSPSESWSVSIEPKTGSIKVRRELHELWPSTIGRPGKLPFYSGRPEYGNEVCTVVLVRVNTLFGVSRKSTGLAGTGK